MRGMSKAAKAAAYDAVRVEAALASQALWFIFNETPPDGIEIVDPSETERIEFRLYGALRADGGMVIQIYRIAGQRTCVEVRRFDDWHRAVDATPFGVGANSEIKIAASRLYVKRHALFVAEATARS